MQVSCGHCKGYHSSSQAVLNCMRVNTPPPAPAPITEPWQTRRASKRQMDMVNDLCDGAGIPRPANPITGASADEIIRSMKARRTHSMSQTVHGAQILPLSMVKRIRPGRYAVPNNDNTEYIFMRISMPRKYKGHLLVSSKHSDSWYRRVMYAPDGKVVSHNNQAIKGMSLSDILISIVADQTTAAIEYATRANECARCGRELTDDRSRHFGIGPECEKNWPHIINEVTERKGEYVPGAASR